MHDSKDGLTAGVGSGPSLTGNADAPLLETAPTPPEDPYVGRNLDGRFTLLQILGRGGMGCVYRALQHSMEREVAVKVLAPEMAASEDSVLRFLNEARIASRLRHPNTVMVLDFGRTEDGLLYLAMELLQGRPLGDILKADEALPPERVSRIVRQICDSLEEAHAIGLAHRDLKPDNVFILQGSGHRDTVKVLDFGIARLDEGRDTRLTAPGTVLGTPIYMSPEQVRGQTADGRSDIYSLGVMMFELLTGSAPFEGSSAVEVMVMHLTAPVPDVATVLPDAPAGLSRLVQSMLSKEPTGRPSTVREVREALEALSFDDRRPVTTPSPAAPRPLAEDTLPPRLTPALWAETGHELATPPSASATAPLVIRRKGGLVAAGAALLLAIGVTVAFIASHGDSRAPTTAAPPPSAESTRPTAPPAGGVEAPPVEPTAPASGTAQGPAQPSPIAENAAPASEAATPTPTVDAIPPAEQDPTAEAAATLEPTRVEGSAPDPAKADGSGAAATLEPARVEGSAPEPAKADGSAPDTAPAATAKSEKSTTTKTERPGRVDRPKGDLADKYGLK